MLAPMTAAPSGLAHHGSSRINLAAAASESLTSVRSLGTSAIKVYGPSSAHPARLAAAPSLSSAAHDRGAWDANRSISLSFTMKDKTCTSNAKERGQLNAKEWSGQAS